jgi:hypothetical protein
MSVELAFERLDGAAPERAIAFLHGILGRGQNLKNHRATVYRSAAVVDGVADRLARAWAVS